MPNSLTAKQIAQTYVLNEILIHELILEALSEIEIEILQGACYTRSDIIFRINMMVTKDDLADIFEISHQDVLTTIRNEYTTEIDSLVAKTAQNPGP